MARTPLSLKARAIALLAQREHSRAELRRKLLSIERRSRAAAQAGSHAAPEDAAEAADITEAAVDALLDSLAAAGYLDETRFVESRLHVRAGRFGIQRIEQELAQHGLKLDAQQRALLRETELERAREVWLKRFGPEPERGATEQARQSRFLLARGFSAELVRRLLRG
ncbi:MAG: regulatory protein RecX [Comamonadaceae bacterium]|nr:regulatory protein RecX [Comamonadaceae bacterium]